MERRPGPQVRPDPPWVCPRRLTPPLPPPLPQPCHRAAAHTPPGRAETASAPAWPPTNGAARAPSPARPTAAAASHPRSCAAASTTSAHRASRARQHARSRCGRAARAVSGSALPPPPPTAPAAARLQRAPRSRPPGSGASRCLPRSCRTRALAHSPRRQPILSGCLRPTSISTGAAARRVRWRAARARGRVAQAAARSPTQRRTRTLPAHACAPALLAAVEVDRSPLAGSRRLRCRARQLRRPLRRGPGGRDGRRSHADGHERAAAPPLPGQIKLSGSLCFACREYCCARSLGCETFARVPPAPLSSPPFGVPRATTA